jgi:hypothetical protein
VGGLTIAREWRWSGWRVGMISIGSWHLLVLLAAVVHRADFTSVGLVNWYTLRVALGLCGIAALGLVMHRRGLRPASA